MKRGQLLQELKCGALAPRLREIYGPRKAGEAAERLVELVEEFAGIFPCSANSETLLFSTPGRTELGGNHTDHQRGHGLAASVDLDTIACVVPNESGVIRIKSRHHRMAEIRLDQLEARAEETGSSPALVRGVASRFRQLGCTLGGFDAYTTTNVLRGSGVSSSAAFEVLVATILNHLFCGGALSPTEIAQIGQFAENVYFGKPCGLLDQLARATGGVISIDFADPAKPAVKQVSVDLEKQGYRLCIVDSQASHADLTEDYAAIPAEMAQVAACFGKEYLSQVEPETFRRELAGVRRQCGDRAALRAHHYFKDDERAVAQHEALERGDLDAFLHLVNQSGRSSFMYLQNVSTHRDSRVQPLAVLLAGAEELLDGRGACRVHGGGFAGTIQAYVPEDLVEAFIAGMDAMGGKVHVLNIRNKGAVHLV